MILGTSYLTQIRGGEDSGQLVGGSQDAAVSDSPRSLGGWVALQLSQLVATIGAGYHKQHNTDDTHGVITCASISERSRTTPMGEWITAATADPTAFVGSGGMTWTVDIADQANVSYTLVGKTMTLSVRLDSTSVGGVLGPTLSMRIPGGFTAARQAAVPCLMTDNTVAFNTLCFMRVLANSKFVDFQRYDVANFQASANLTYIQAAQLSFEVT